jgi:G3E family GTPase
VNGLDDVMATVSSGEAGEKYASQLQGAKANLLRSKGFVWMATSAQAGYFVSHAGQFLELMILGRWWADIARSDWPEGQEDEIMIDFDGDHGDRRQEIVFIGLFDETSSEAGTNSKKSLEEVLDTCLLTDEEMAQYVATTGLGDEALRKLWFP